MSLRSRSSFLQYMHKNRTKILGGPLEEPDLLRFCADQRERSLQLGSHQEVLA